MKNQQIYNGMTVAEIIERIGKMCTEGLNRSSIIEMRKTLKALSRDMHIEPTKYRKPLDKSIIIKVENK